MNVEFTKANSQGQPTLVKANRAGNTAMFWPVHEHLVIHDLAHFAIEQELGYTEGFWGLISKGWNVEMFIGRMPKLLGSSVLPHQAYYAEIIVAALHSDVNCTERSAGNVVSHVLDECISAGLPMPDICNEDILRARKALKLILNRWNELQPEEKLVLTFNPSKAVNQAAFSV